MTESISVQYASRVSDDLEAFFADGFRTDSVQKSGAAREAYVFFHQGDDGRFAAAVDGYVLGRDAYIKRLMVAETYRGQGLGKALLDRVESFSAEKDCRAVWVDTLTYQAPDFYTQNGFREAGLITEYCGPHDRVFYNKEIH